MVFFFSTLLIAQNVYNLNRIKYINFKIIYKLKAENDSANEYGRLQLRCI